MQNQRLREAVARRSMEASQRATPTVEDPAATLAQSPALAPVLLVPASATATAPATATVPAPLDAGVSAAPPSTESSDRLEEAEADGDALTVRPVLASAVISVRLGTRTTAEPLGEALRLPLLLFPSLLLLLLAIAPSS